MKITTSKKSGSIRSISTKTEREIEREVLDILANTDGVFAWKNHSVGIFDQKRGVYRRPNCPHTIKGVSDIIGVCSGRAFFFEIKTRATKKRVSDHQQLFLWNAMKHGAYVAVIYDADQTIEHIARLKGGEYGGNDEVVASLILRNEDKGAFIGMQESDIPF